MLKYFRFSWKITFSNQIKKKCREIESQYGFSEKKILIYVKKFSAL